MGQAKKQIRILLSKRIKVLIINYIFNKIILDFDWKAFESDCKKIVKEISDRFIDLGLDDHNSEYGQDLLQKQEKFRKELDKKEKDFKFDAETLHLPKGHSDNEHLLEHVDDHIG